MDKTMDDTRAAKIANIKEAIIEGTYHVSAEVARRFIPFNLPDDDPGEPGDRCPLRPGWGSARTPSPTLLPLTSRLAIGLWVIREVLVKSGIQPKYVSRLPDPFHKGCPTTKSKLLQKKSDSLDESDEVLDDQPENTEDSSEPSEARNRTTRLLTPRPASQTQLPAQGLNFKQALANAAADYAAVTALGQVCSKAAPAAAGTYHL
jgi:hypothetical protein